MRRQLPILLIFFLLLGSTGMSVSQDFQKGVDAYDRGDYATALPDPCHASWKYGRAVNSGMIRSMMKKPCSRGK
jgi:hypothetical protein